MGLWSCEDLLVQLSLELLELSLGFEGVAVGDELIADGSEFGSTVRIHADEGLERLYSFDGRVQVELSDFVVGVGSVGVRPFGSETLGLDGRDLSVLLGDGLIFDGVPFLFSMGLLGGEGFELTIDGQEVGGVGIESVVVGGHDMSFLSVQVPFELDELNVSEMRNGGLKFEKFLWSSKSSQSLGRNDEWKIE